MKNITTKLSAAAASIATALVLFAGHAYAEGEDVAPINEMTNPALEGANAARANGMPAEFIGVNGAFNNITNVILYAVGLISVIMLIFGGIRYALSGGDQSKVTAAKNTVIYAIIGLIVALLSFAIINFVLGALGTVTNQ